MLKRTAASLGDNGVMVSKENASIDVQLHVTSQHTRRCRRSGLAQAERLREGYRYSVLSAMAAATPSYCSVHQFIVVIEVRTVQDTRCCVRNMCLLQLTVVSHLFLQ